MTDTTHESFIFVINELVLGTLNRAALNGPYINANKHIHPPSPTPHHVPHISSPRGGFGCYWVTDGC